MIYYCRHHRKTIAGGKVISYCLPKQCWALKMFSNLGQVKKFKRNLQLCEIRKK